MRLMNLIIYLLFLVVISRGDRAVPVLLIDFDGIIGPLDLDNNPFAKLPSSRFAEIAQEVLKNSKAVINFIEDTLCTEDVSTKDSNGSAYTYLRESLSRNQTQYLPAVNDPYDTLKQTFEVQDNNVFKLRNGMRLYDPHLTHYYVHFADDESEQRIETLRRHDNIIREVYFAMKDAYGEPVVAFYTGKSNPVLVKRYATVPLKQKVVSGDPSVIVESNGALFRFSGVYATSQSRYSRFSQKPVVSDERGTRRSLSTKVAYTDFDLQFNFTFKKDSWTLDEVALLEGGEEVGRRSVGGGAPWDWSYVCGEPLVVINTRDGSAVTISQYQIQPFRRTGRSSDEWRLDDPPAAPDTTTADASQSDTSPTDAPAADASSPDASKSETTSADPSKVDASEGDPSKVDASQGDPSKADASKGDPSKGDTSKGDAAKGNDTMPGLPAAPKTFGKSVHCGPYFSSSILAGLMVSGILLGILFVAVAAVYGCQSNSRYDDAQGKALVIATEN